MPDFHEYYFYVFNLIPKFTDNEKWGYHKGKLLNGHAQTYLNVSKKMNKP